MVPRLEFAPPKPVGLGGVFGVASGVAEGFATLILAVYMMLDYDRIGQTLLRVFPEPWQPLVADLSRNVSVAVGGYLKGQLLIALYSVRSARQLCEQLEYNLLFRWFLDLNLLDPIWDNSTFS